MKYASLNLKVKTVDAENFQIRAVFSTANEDRQGEIVKQDGWKLDNFLRNPVVLWAHDMYAPAIGKVVDIGIIDGNLEGTIQFAAKEYDFAETIYKLYAGGYVNAISVGFMNYRWQYDEANDQMLLLENELYEVSCVNVPANALALAKSKGVDITPIEKRQDRAEGVREKLLGKLETPPTDEPQDPQEEPEQPSVDVPDPHEKQIDGIVAVANAIELIAKSDNGVIQAAVRDLTSRLDVASKSTQRGSSAEAPKKNSVRQVNRVISRLHKAKAKIV